MSNHIIITEKNYKKLAIQVSLNGLSFCCKNILSNEIVFYKDFIFENFNKNTKIEDLFANVFLENPELKESYDEIVLIHNNNLATFVPDALFDEDYLGSYLQFNTKVFETDFFAFDDIENHQLKNVYIPYININNFFIDQFGSFDYKHANSILLSKLLNLSKNIDEKTMYTHINPFHFEIVVVQNQKLIFFNSFDYKTPEDFIYYTLFTAEQLQMNPEKFILSFIGNVSEFDDYYQIAYKYIRNISLIDISDLMTKNNFSEAENRANFILFNL